MVTDSYVLYAKCLDSALRNFEESDVLDLERDSDEKDHDQEDFEDMCNTENDLTLNIDVKGQDVGYSDEDDGIIVTHGDCGITNIIGTERLWWTYGY